MELPEYRRLYELEDEMWWFRGMERISLSLLRPHLRNNPTADILDAGCGTGGMLARMSEYGRATGIDRSPEALELASKRDGVRIARAEVEALPFASESFDVVTSFDVLYHLDVGDDIQALREIRRVMRPGAVCLIRVPAHDALRSRHDEAVHTRQRYARHELVEKLEQAGLSPERVSFANAFLFPVAFLRRRMERRPSENAEAGPGESEVQAASPWLNALLTLPLNVESWLVPRVSLPFGLSLVALARRPAS